MKVQFKPNEALTSKINDLPLLKNYNKDQITSTFEKMTNGQKFTSLLTGGAILTGIGFAAYYIIPKIFQALGQLAYYGTIVAGSIIFVLALPALVRFAKSFGRSLHKLAINNDPFLELEIQKEKLEENREKFQRASSKIINIQAQAENAAQKNEEDAKRYQNSIVKIETDVNKAKTKMSELLAKYGEDVKMEDEYIQLNTDFIKKVAEGKRLQTMLEQAKNMVRKYGARVKMIRDLNRKLIMAETALDIKSADFDATVDILKKDYEFAKSAKDATNAVKETMLFDSEWEVEYALDVVTTTIVNDIAATTNNLKTIDNLTQNYNFDADELYKSLSEVSEKIKVGDDIVPKAKAYNSPDYQLTTADRNSSTNMSGLF